VCDATRSSPERYDSKMANSPHGNARVAFFGGSFDPPHLGHLAVARAAREALALDTVLFAPVGAQPLKQQRGQDGASASFDDRVAMTQLAIAGEPGFAISLADAPKDSGEPNYTIETLETLRAELPPESVLFCLIGADSFFSLRRWRRAAEIPFAASLIVASRPGLKLDDLEPALPGGLTVQPFAAGGTPMRVDHFRSYVLHDSLGRRAPFYVLPAVHVEISASEIREQVRAASGRSGAEQRVVPRAVFDFIRSKGLYR